MLSLEYIAGYVDGEGSIGVYSGTNKSGRNGYHLTVSVANTFPCAVAELKSRFGGSIRQKPSPQTAHRTQYLWQVTGDNARAFLAAIIPFLVEKKPQAQLALTLPKRSNHGRMTLPEHSIMDEQERIAHTLKQMKRTTKERC